MKKSLRLALAAVALLSVGTIPAFATVGGTDPHPPQVATASNSSLVMHTVLSALSL